MQLAEWRKGVLKHIPRFTEERTLVTIPKSVEDLVWRMGSTYCLIPTERFGEHAGSAKGILHILQETFEPYGTAVDFEIKNKYTINRQKHTAGYDIFTAYKPHATMGCDVGYRCGDCKDTFAGPPEFFSYDTGVYILCRGCTSLMDHKEL